MDPWWESRICWFELNTLDLAASIVFTRFALCALSCPRLQTSAGTLAWTSKKFSMMVVSRMRKNKFRNFWNLGMKCIHGNEMYSCNRSVHVEIHLVFTELWTDVDDSVLLTSGLKRPPLILTCSFVCGWAPWQTTLTSGESCMLSWTLADPLTSSCWRGSLLIMGMSNRLLMAGHRLPKGEQRKATLILKSSKTLAR